MSENSTADEENTSQEELTDFEKSVLEFERNWYVYGGAKDYAIRERFDMSASRYFHALGTLLDKPAAYIADPILIKRLRRIRESRQKERSRNRSLIS